MPADEVLLGQRIAEVLPASGWHCSHPGPLGLHQVHLHSSIESALACGSTQAFLGLPAGRLPATNNHSGSRRQRAVRTADSGSCPTALFTSQDGRTGRVLRERATRSAVVRARSRTGNASDTHGTDTAALDCVASRDPAGSDRDSRWSPHYGNENRARCP
jgi:hypothetical protein